MALIDYNKVIEINPINDANAYNNRGIDYLDKIREFIK